MADGRDYFRASIDHSQFDRDAAHIRGSFSDIGRTAESEGLKIENSLKKVGATIAGVFTLQKASEFAKDIANVRGEFQQLEIAFETMLGSKVKSDALMSQLIDTAAKTPFDLTGVANGAKQLLAYGTASEKVNETLIRLGDVASGLSIPLNDLVYLYGTTQVQGRIFSKDIYQFMGRGIPIIKELSKELNVSEDSVMELVSAGKVGFPELQKVFENLTNEGGMFFNLMEKQSASITGQIANLEDAYDVMLNEIGKKSESTFTAAIDIATLLVENYETVGEVIAGLVVVYGTYKAAVIALNIVQRLQGEIALQNALSEGTLSTAQGLRAVVTRQLTVAQAALNKTVLANPYVLATMALVGLGYAMYKVITYQNESEKAQSRLNDAMKEAEKSSISESRELARLKGELSAATKGTDEYNTIKEKIVKNYGKYYDGLQQEIEKVGLLETTYNKLTEAIQKSFGARQYQSFIQAEQENLDNVMSENLGKIQERLYKDLGDEAGARIYSQIRKSIIEGTELSADVVKTLDKVQDKGTIMADSRIDGYIRKIREAQKVTDEIDKKAKVKFGIEDSDIKTDDNSAPEVKKVKNLAEQTNEARKAVTKLKQELADLRSGKSESGNYAKDIEEKAKELKTAEDKLSFILTGKASSSSYKNSNQVESIAQKQLEAQRKIDEEDKQRQIEKLKFGFEMRQREIDLMDDNFDKRIKQIKLNFDREDQAIKEYEKSIAKDQLEYVKNRFVSEKGSDKGFEAYFSELKNNNFLDKKGESVLPDGLRPEDIVNTVALMNKAAKDEQEKGMKEINKDLSIMLKEQELIFSSDLDKKLADLDNYYNEQIIKAGTNAELIALIESNRKRAKQEVNVEDKIQKLDFDEQLEIERMAGLESIGMTELVEEKKLEITRKYIKLRIEALKPLAEAGDKNAQNELKLLEASLKNIDFKKPANGLKALADKKLFDVITKGFQKLGSSPEEAEEKTTKLFNGIRSNAAKVVTVVGELQSAFGGLDDGLDEAMSAVGNIASGFAQGGIIGGAIAAIGEGIKLFAKASEAEKRHQAALKEIAQGKVDLQRQYNILLLEQNLLLEEATSIFGEKEIYKAANAIKVYRDAVQQYKDELQGSFKPNEAYEKGLEKAASSGGIMSQYFRKQLDEYRKQVDAYEKGIGALYSAEVVTGHKKTGLFGWGKGKDTYSRILEVYPDLIDKENKLNKERAQSILDTQKMSDETRKLIEQLIALQDQSEAALEELRNYLQQTFGDLGSGAIDSIVDSIKNGTDAWVEFGKVGASVLEKLGEQIAYELFFADKFQKLQDDLEKVYGSGKSSDQIAKEAMNLVSSFYQNIGSDMDNAQQWMQNWKEQAEKQGFDLWKPDTSSSQSSSSRGFETMTQDQAGELNGRFTAIQMTTASIDVKLDNVLTLGIEQNSILKSHAIQFQELRDIGLQSMYHLEDIVKNTKVLPEMAENIKGIKKNTEEL